MKKILVIASAVVLTACTLAGCRMGSNTNTTAATITTTRQTTTTTRATTVTTMPTTQPTAPTGTNPNGTSEHTDPTTNINGATNGNRGRNRRGPMMPGNF